MREILFCKSCSKYTMKRICQGCGQKTIKRKPAKFSLPDKYVELRVKQR